MEYHVYGRLFIAQQVRIKTDENTPGFSSKQEAIDFAKRHCFNYTVFYRENGRKVIVDYKE